MGNPAIDPSVGGLVWVRRRNGSWWPGRIMGLDELSEGCLVSPRSGTPVKLLGREDASIDWYNLEKSKRVKAFRCGEYDECIKKAKAASANSCKKTVKYARREDAILHALELENARLGKGCLDLSCRGDTSSSDHGIATIKSSPMSDSSEEEKDLVNHLDNSSESARELSRSGLSFEEPNHVSSLSEQGRRRRTPNDSEDDGMERVKRMKGLEDLGMNVLSKGEDKEELLPLEHLSDFNAGKCTSNGYPLDGCKVYSSSSKRKRSQVPNVNELLKRKNRRRPLTKLLESTAMVSVPVVCDEILMPSNSPPQGLSDGRVPGAEFSESKMSFSAVNNDKSDSVGVTCEAVEASPFNMKVNDADFPSIFALAENNSSDKLFDVPFVGEGKYSAGNQSSQSSQVETVCLRKEVPNESGSTSSAAAHGDHNFCQANERGTSEWQSKGKRNLRDKDRKQETRKYGDRCDEYMTSTEFSDICSHGLGQKLHSNGIGQSLLNSCTLRAKPKKVLDDGLPEGKPMCQKETHMRGQTGLNQLPDEPVMPQRLPPFQQSCSSVHSFQKSDFSVRNFCSDASLYSVKIEVKASHRPQHVPLVSLMSKLNGKAIVGHPLTIEILRVGYSDQWLNGLQTDLEDEGIRREARPRSRARSIKVKHLESQTRISIRKSSKTKKAAQLSKKIRKLSSFTGQKHLKGVVIPAVEKPKGPLIAACIPLKVVFSRINEALSGGLTR